MQQQYKELHLASDLESLNRIALSNASFRASFQRPSTVMTVAKKIYTRSQSDPLDEEMTYILLCRFIQVYDHLVFIHTDKNFVTMMLGKEARTARAQLEDVKHNLIIRYKEANLKKSISVVVSEPIMPQPSSTSSVFNNVLFISCSELFLAHSNKDFNLLIMDARSAEDYAESHIKDIKCINIPESCIQSGLSAHRLGQSLPSTSKDEWEKRDTFDAVILMDWNTNKTNFSASKLDKLRTILVDWDVGRNYSEKPVILKDGYIEWLEMYPTTCTSSDVKYTKANSSLDELLNLEIIEYPSESESKSHDVFDQKLSKTLPLSVSQLKSRDEILEEEIQVIERNNEVTKKLIEQEKEWRLIHDQIDTESDMARIEQLKKEELLAEEAISQLSEEEAALMEKKSQLASDFNLAASFTPTDFLPKERAHRLEDVDKLQRQHLDMVKARRAFADYRRRLLDDARQCKKPKVTFPDPVIIKKTKERPTVDRLTKPKSIHLPVLVNHIDGKLQQVSNGLTSLVNIKNTCYMNSIIQCFRHIPEVMAFYCNGDYTKHLHRNPPIISKEFAHLIRALWSNSYSVIKPQEFYKKFTTLSPVFKAGHHEDCMEFFLQLYNYLNEDCSVDISARNYWSESQLAWYRQHGGKISFYINTFYHQIRVEHSCSNCHTSNLKFDIENVFYVPIPNVPFDVKECVDSYLYSKDNLVCRKCQQEKDVKKIITFYPSVLVIALKRHIQDYTEDRTVVYKKNEQRCTFDVEDFEVGTSLYTLNAISLHLGTLQVGHYTAVCRNPINNKWYHFNDDSVGEVDLNTPLVQERAYAFFYSLKSTRGRKVVRSEEALLNTFECDET